MEEENAMPRLEQLQDFEARAEAAYAALYDAPAYAQKDLKDDACLFLARAAEIAQALGRIQDVARLKARSDEIATVFNSQFRHIGT